MNAQEKIDLIKQKLDLLLKLSADFTDYCTSELQILMELVERQAAKGGGVSENQGKIIAVKEQLDKQIEAVLQGYATEKEQITLQMEALKSVKDIEEMDKMGEITSILLSEVDTAEDLSTFKMRVLQQELDERKAFKCQIEDMKSVLEEGGIMELEAFFEEWLIDNAEDDYYQGQCEECEDPDSCDHMDEDDDEDDKESDDEEDDDDDDEDEEEITPKPKGHKNKS